MTTYTRARPRVYIELVSAPLEAADPGDWIEITGKVESIAFSHGRSKANDDFQPGSGSVVLDNRDGDFDPSNEDGAYYPNLKLRRKIRVDLFVETYDSGSGSVLGSFDITLSYGFVTSWGVNWQWKTRVPTTVTWTDTLGLLSNHDLPDSVWDWRIREHVDAGKVVAWYRWGDDEATAVDASGNGNHGRYVIAENGADPTSAARAPVGVVRAGKGDPTIPQVERSGLSFGKMVAEAGQPATAPTLGWRFPCVVAHDSTALWGTEFTVETWVRYRAAYSLSAAGLASSTTARYQWLGYWGYDPYFNSRALGFNLTGAPAASAASYTEFVPGTPPALWFGLPAIGTSGTTSIDDNQVHHIVWVVTRTTSGGYDRSTITPYIDGVAQTAINITDVDYPTPGGRPMMIGFQHQRIYPSVAPSLDFGFGLDIGDVVVYNQALSSGDVLTNYRAGKYGNLTASANLTAGDAFEQALAMAGFQPAPTVAITDDKEVAAGKTAGQRVTDHLRTLGRSIDGLVWQDRYGDVRFDGEGWRRSTGGTVVAYLQDTAILSSGEIGYEQCDLSLDDGSLANSWTVNFDGGSRTAEDASSISEHGRYEQSVTTLLTDPDDAEGLAQFRVLQRATPQIEVGRVKFALDMDSLSFVQSSCDVRYRVNLTRTRPNGTVLLGDYWIESVTHEISGPTPGVDQGRPFSTTNPGAVCSGVWDITLTLSRADWPGTPFILDTSELDGPDLLWF